MLTQGRLTCAITKVAGTGFAVWLWTRYALGRRGRCTYRWCSRITDRLVAEPIASSQEEAAQHRVKPTPPLAAAKRAALAVVLFGAGSLVGEGRAARLTQAVRRLKPLSRTPMNSLQGIAQKPPVIVGLLFVVIGVLLANAIIRPPSLESVALASVASIRDSCTEPPINQVPVQAQTWKAQTFTPGSSYMLYFVDLPGTNLGGITTLHIRQTYNGQPSGTDMAAASITSGNRFIFATPVSFTQQQTYALVLSNEGGSYHWSYSGSATCYSSGHPFTSLNGGLNWSIDIVDFNFIIYDSDSTPEPTPTPTPGPALTHPTVYVISFPFSTPATDPQLLTENLIQLLKRASMYHGYSNPSAQPYLEHLIYSGAVVSATTLPPKLPNGLYDYAEIYNQYNLCSLIQAGQVDEVWLWDAGQGGFLEWVTNGPEWSMTWGANPPNCGKQVTTMVFNYNRELDVALESFSHRLEGFFMHYFPCDFYTETWPWTGWPSQCVGIVSDRYGFVARPFSGNNYVGVCGDAHCPPNILDGHEYDYSNPTIVQSICEDWQWNETATVKSFSCEEWGCSHTGYHVWWMQNLPGLNNTNSDRNGNPQPNWWAYIFGTEITV